MDIFSHTLLKNYIVCLKKRPRMAYLKIYGCYFSKPKIKAIISWLTWGALAMSLQIGTSSSLFVFSFAGLRIKHHNFTGLKVYLSVGLVFLASFIIIFVFSIQSMENKILPMTEFKTLISGVKSNCSTNWPTAWAMDFSANVSFTIGHGLTHLPERKNRYLS